MGEGKISAPQVLTRVCQRLGARGMGKALLRDSPRGESGLPLAVKPRALSEHVEVKTAAEHESAVLRPEPVAPGKVGAS